MNERCRYTIDNAAPFVEDMIDTWPFVCCNDDDNGFVTLFRVYPPGINAVQQYKNELQYTDCLNALIRHNRFLSCKC